MGAMLRGYWELLERYLRAPLGAVGVLAGSGEMCRLWSGEPETAETADVATEERAPWVRVRE